MKTADEGAAKQREKSLLLFAQHVTDLMNDGYMANAIAALDAFDVAAEARGRLEGLREAAKIADASKEEEWPIDGREEEFDEDGTHAYASSVAGGIANRLRALASGNPPKAAPSGPPQAKAVFVPDPPTKDPAPTFSPGKQEGAATPGTSSPSRTLTEREE